MESSGGREDQFWATGISEPLPPPSRPSRRAPSSHRADREQSYRTPSPIPYPSSSHLDTTHLAMERANTFPKTSRRKVVSSISLSRKKARVPTPHALASNRALSRMTRSAGPYSSPSSRSNPRNHRNSYTVEGSFHSVGWNQPTGQVDSSFNYEYQLPFERSPMSSRGALRMPSMTPQHLVRRHLDFGGHASSSLSADGSFPPLPSSSQGASPLPMTPRTDYSIPGSDFHNLENWHDPNLQVGGSGRLETLLGATDGFGPYDSSAFQANDLSLLWSGDQGSQKPEQLMPMDPTAMLLPPLPITSNSVHVPADNWHEAFPFTQLAQPSSEMMTTSSLNEHQAFDFTDQMYGALNDVHVTNQFTNFHFPHPSVDAISLDTFPNIVQDEDGLLRLGGTG